MCVSVEGEHWRPSGSPEDVERKIELKGVLGDVPLWSPAARDRRAPRYPVSYASTVNIAPNSWNLAALLSLRSTNTANFGFAGLPEMKLPYCCTVISVPACVVKPLYVAIVGWSPLASEGGTTTLN